MPARDHPPLPDRPPGPRATSPDHRETRESTWPYRLDTGRARRHARERARRARAPTPPTRTTRLPALQEGLYQFLPASPRPAELIRTTSSDRYAALAA